MDQPTSHLPPGCGFLVEAPSSAATSEAFRYERSRHLRAETASHSRTVLRRGAAPLAASRPWVCRTSPNASVQAIAHPAPSHGSLALNLSDSVQEVHRFYWRHGRTLDRSVSSRKLARCLLHTTCGGFRITELRSESPPDPYRCAAFAGALRLRVAAIAGLEKRRRSHRPLCCRDFGAARLAS